MPDLPNNGRWTYGDHATSRRSKRIVNSGIGNIVLDYLIDLGRFQAELALMADREDLAEKVFARCEALVETLTLEMEYKRASEGPENQPEWNDAKFPTL
jgi:hypothetical protein